MRRALFSMQQAENIALQNHNLRAWQGRVFAACWLTYAGYYLGRVNLSVALPAMQAEFHWSKTAAGSIGTALFWAYAMGQLINGYLGERLSARRLVAFGLIASAALNLCFSTTSWLGAFVVIWMLNGLAQATGWAPIMKTLSHWFDPTRRARLIAFFTPCYVAGYAASWALGGWLVATLNWRASFYIPALLMLGVATGWYALVRDAPPSSQPNPPSIQGRISLKDALAVIGDVARHPRLRWALGVSVLSSMVKDGLTLWAPTYLVEQHGLSVDRAAFAGLVIPIAGVAGIVLAAWMLHHFSKGREAPLVALLAFGILLALGTQVASPRAGLAIAIPLLGLAALGAQGINALLTTSLPLSMASQGQVASTSGVLDFACYVGSGLSAVLGGALQDHYGWGGLFVGWAIIMGGATLLAAYGARRQRIQNI